MTVATAIARIGPALRAACGGRPPGKHARQAGKPALTLYASENVAVRSCNLADEPRLTRGSHQA